MNNSDEQARRKIKHVMNGDFSGPWYCYACQLVTRNVQEAAEHDGTITEEGVMPAHNLDPLEEAIEQNGQPCPNCGAGMTGGVCDNLCRVEDAAMEADYQAALKSERIYAAWELRDRNGE
jgi:hypothetical protein